MSDYASNGAPAPVSKIGFIEVRTQDTGAMIDYYTNVLNFALVERTPDAAYMTTGPDHHCTVVTRGEPHGRARLGFEIHGSLDDTEVALRERGIEAERLGDPEPGIAEALEIPEPNTDTRIQLYERQAGSGVATALGARPTKLGHVASYAPDLATAQRFYEEVLGFRWSDTIGDFFAFLRCNTDHHAINIMESQKYAGLYHIAYEMRDFSHLKDGLDTLAAHGHALEWGPGRHGAGHNIFTYHRDPDGNIIELFTEVDQIFDEEKGHFEPRPWHEEFPQRPKFWPLDPSSANKWGPVNAEHMDH